MAPRLTLALVGAAAVLVEAGAGILSLTAAGPSRITAFLLVSAVATAVVTAGLWHLLGIPPREGGGPSGGAPSDEPPPPPWWPQFEEDFREYAERVRA